MSISTKKPKLDYLAMLGDPDEQKLRTLREIHAEVGFPFTATAHGPPLMGTPTHIPIGADVHITGTHPEPHQFPGALPGDIFFVRDGLLDLAIKVDVPRWVLLGHK